MDKIEIPQCPIQRPVYALPGKVQQLSGIGAQQQLQLVVQQNHEWIQDLFTTYSPRVFWCKFCLRKIEITMEKINESNPEN